MLLAVAGAAIFLANLLPRALFRRSASSSALLMLMGLLAFNLMPGMPLALDPVASPRFWEVASEIVVLVVLFSTGLRIDTIGSLCRWIPTLSLLPAFLTVAVGLATQTGSTPCRDQRRRAGSETGSPRQHARRPLVDGEDARMPEVPLPGGGRPPTDPPTRMATSWPSAAYGYGRLRPLCHQTSAAPQPSATLHRNVLDRTP